MVEMKTPGEVDAIRAAGRVVAGVLAAATRVAGSVFCTKPITNPARSTRMILV